MLLILFSLLHNVTLSFLFFIYIYYFFLRFLHFKTFHLFFLIINPTHAAAAPSLCMCVFVCVCLSLCVCVCGRKQILFKWIKITIAMKNKEIKLFERNTHTYRIYNPIMFQLLLMFFRLIHFFFPYNNGVQLLVIIILLLFTTPPTFFFSLSGWKCISITHQSPSCENIQFNWFGLIVIVTLSNANWMAKDKFVLTRISRWHKCQISTLASEMFYSVLWPQSHEKA